MEESYKHYAKPDKKTTYCNCIIPFIYKNFPNGQIHTDKKYISSFLGVGWGRREQRGDMWSTQGFFWRWCNILKLTGVITVQLYNYNENYWIVYFKWVKGMVCEQYLSKAITKKKQKTKNRDFYSLIFCIHIFFYIYFLALLTFHLFQSFFHTRSE